MARVSITFSSEDWGMVIQALDFTKRAEMRASDLTRELLGDVAGYAYADRAAHFAQLQRAVENEVAAAMPPAHRF